MSITWHIVLGCDWKHFHNFSNDFILVMACSYIISQHSLNCRNYQLHVIWIIFNRIRPWLNVMGLEKSRKRHNFYAYCVLAHSVVLQLCITYWGYYQSKLGDMIHNIKSSPILMPASALHDFTPFCLRNAALVTMSWRCNIYLYPKWRKLHYILKKTNCAWCRENVTIKQHTELI